MATKQATKWKEKGNAAFKQGDHAKAIEYYTYATEMDPKNPIFFTNRSTAYFKMEKYDKSLRDANKAIKLDAKWPKGYYRKGMVLMHEEKYQDALKDFQKALSLKPDSLAFEKAVADCKAMTMQNCTSGEILKMEGNDLFKSGEIEKAIQKYSSAIAACQDNAKENLIKADVYANRAACYRQLYNSKQVIDDCTAALVLNPNHVKALIRRGQALESTEKFKEALADFQQALIIAPGTPVCVQGAGRIRAALRREKANSSDQKL